MTNLVTCRYCNGFAELVDGDVLYPTVPRLRHKPYWLCKNCDAYTSCKPNTTEPRSPLANAEERRRRQEWWAKKQSTRAKQ